MIIKTHNSHHNEKKAAAKMQYSLFQVTMYGVGLILGAGIYIIIGDIVGIAGNITHSRRIIFEYKSCNVKN